MNVKFQRERAHDLWDEITPLLVEHHAEIATWPDIALEPDIPGYCDAEDAGQLRCYTARHNEALIGYGAFIVRPAPHYQGSLQAVQDVLFVTGPYRRGRVGVQLVDYCEQQLRDEGVQVIMQHVKLAHPALGELLMRRGYRPLETIYAKRMY